MEVLMKHVTAILMLLILMIGCSPSGNTATSQSQTPVTDTGKSAQPPAVDSISKARISSLESELAKCQSINTNLQKQIDQLAAANNIPSVKEPVSGDSGSYTMKSDKPGLQYQIGRAHV
jgi:PBP1b-binding outer membrane lipoprotein LpoB